MSGKSERKIEIYYPPEDKRFMENMSRTFDAPRRLIEHLDAEQLGRAIVYTGTVKDEDGEEQDITKTLGYILPVNKEKEAQNRHMIILTSGDLYGVECENFAAANLRNEYKKNFTVDPEPWESYNSDKPLAFIGTLKQDASAYGATLLYSSENPTDQPSITRWFNKAMDRVKETREKRELGRAHTDMLINAATIFEKPIVKKPNPPKV